MSAQPDNTTADGRNRNPHHFEKILDRENPEKGDEIWIEGEDQPYTLTHYRKKPDFHVGLEAPNGRSCGIRRSLTNPDELIFVDEESMTATRTVEAYVHEPASAIDVEQDDGDEEESSSGTVTPMPLDASGDVDDPDLAYTEDARERMEVLNQVSDWWAVEVAANTPNMVPAYDEALDLEEITPTNPASDPSPDTISPETVSPDTTGQASLNDFGISAD